MTFITDNLRLKELVLVAQQNKPAFDDFVQFLRTEGYVSLQAFVCDQDSERAKATILSYLNRPLPTGIALYDGIARPYKDSQAKWSLVSWIFRDAATQRLQPMLSSMDGTTPNERKADLLNKVRIFVGPIYPDPAQWEWSSIFEVVVDRLEGSRRAIKGTLFEAIVRSRLVSLFEQNNIPLAVSETEIKLGGETYDVKVLGANGQILLPVKTRETMGGGHAGLFTRDIHKSIAVAHEAGYDCLPIVIAESWRGDLSGLQCRDSIYINLNPNQLQAVVPLLEVELARRLPAFQEII